jgi:CheY-like chemotaxis protein
MRTCTVLSADDGEDDNLLLTQAHRKSLAVFKLRIVNDGQMAIDYLEGREPYQDRNSFPLPDLLLLDLKMPKKNGFDVLDWLGQQEAFKTIPVAVFSSSQDAADLKAAYEKGADWFLMKPVTFEDLIHLMSAIDRWEIDQSPAAFTSLPSYRRPPNTVS